MTVVVATHDREVVRADGEAVLLAQSGVEVVEQRVGHLDHPTAALAHQVVVRLVGEVVHGPAVTDRPAARSPAPRRAQSFETWSWLFMRVSGLALLFLALLHFAITHVLNDVTATDFGFVARRWRSPLWRVFDWSLLGLALVHGLNGLRWIIDDYVRAPARRTAVKAGTYSLSLALFAYGTLTIFTY